MSYLQLLSPDTSAANFANSFVLLTGSISDVFSIRQSSSSALYPDSSRPQAERMKSSIFHPLGSSLIPSRATNFR